MNFIDILENTFHIKNKELVKVILHKNIRFAQVLTLSSTIISLV